MARKNYYLKKTCGIYKITNKLNGHCYVGQSVDIVERWKQHTTPKKNSSGIKGAIMKYGVDNFSFEVIEECAREELNEREIFWIAELKTLTPDGYNLTNGGGYSPEIAEETKLKISESKKKIPVSEETRKKMSESQKGRIISEEHRERLSEVMKGKNVGKIRSEEVRQRISETTRKTLQERKNKQKLRDS